MRHFLKSKIIFTLFFLLLILSTNCKKTGDGITPPAAPTLSSLSVINGIIGDAIIITGKNISNADKVSFSGILSTIIQNSATSITTVVPPGAVVGTNQISIHTSGGTSNELAFEVLKKPDHVDALPPTLSKTIPSAAYSEGPVLIYGDNLSGVIQISFNDKPGIIFTNNKTIVTVSIPKDLPAGNAIIKVRTTLGTAVSSIQILGPLPSGTPVINFSIVVIPPPNYVANISNDWSLGLLSSTNFNATTHTGTLIDPGSDTTGNGDFSITGKYEYYYDKALNYNTQNYIEIINHKINDTLAGQFSSKFNTPCVLKMILVSSKTGLIKIDTFDIRTNFPDIQCEQ